MAAIDTPPTALDVCGTDDVLRGGGVAALVDGRQVAIIRTDADTFHAIDNRDPFTGANVLARGLVGNVGDTWFVASPLRKQRFDLATGACLDDADVHVAVHVLEVVDGRITVSLATE